MVTKRCRQRNLHEMSYTIKYRVKTRMATGVAVSTERVKLNKKEEPYEWTRYKNGKLITPNVLPQILK